MDLPETVTHSFVVKIWLEEATEAPEQTLWRGYITHVGTGERRYIQRLEDITAFISHFLNPPGLRAAGIRAKMQQIRRWYRKLFRSD